MNKQDLDKLIALIEQWRKQSQRDLEVMLHSSNLFRKGGYDTRQKCADQLDLLLKDLELECQEDPKK